MAFTDMYQAGDVVNMLGMGGQVNPMTVVLFIHQQGTLPGSLREQNPPAHSMLRKEVLLQDSSGLTV